MFWSHKNHLWKFYWGLWISESVNHLAWIQRWICDSLTWGCTIQRHSITLWICFWEHCLSYEIDIHTQILFELFIQKPTSIIGVQDDVCTMLMISPEEHCWLYRVNVTHNSQTSGLFIRPVYNPEKKRKMWIDLVLIG